MCKRNSSYTPFLPKYVKDDIKSEICIIKKNLSIHLSFDIFYGIVPSSNFEAVTGKYGAICICDGRIGQKFVFVICVTRVERVLF